MSKFTHIKLHYSKESYSQYCIRRGLKHTPFDTCVEYADYYEIAKHSWYMRIDKKTLEITSNMRNVDIFERVTDQYVVEIY